jgi:hypothetical protein
MQTATHGHTKTKTVPNQCPYGIAMNKYNDPNSPWHKGFKLLNHYETHVGPQERPKGEYAPDL